MSYVKLRTWDPCEVVSPNFHALNGWDCTDRPQVTQDRTWDPVWSRKSQLPCSQQLRLHGLTSRDLGHSIGTLCEVVSPNFHALNGWDCTDWPQVTHDIELGTLCEVASPNFHALNNWDYIDWLQGTWDIELETPCEVTSPNFHTLNGWDCTDWPQGTWNLGLGTPCEVASRNFHALNGWDCTEQSQVTWD